MIQKEPERRRCGTRYLQYWAQDRELLGSVSRLRRSDFIFFSIPGLTAGPTQCRPFGPQIPSYLL